MSIQVAILFKLFETIDMQVVLKAMVGEGAVGKGRQQEGSKVIGALVGRPWGVAGEVARWAEAGVTEVVGRLPGEAGLVG